MRFADYRHRPQPRTDRAEALILSWPFLVAVLLMPILIALVTK